MNAKLHPPSARPRSQCAFTIVELLVIVAVVALLLTLRFAALASTKDQTMRGQCAGHLRELAFTTAILATDNGDKLPLNTVGSFWAWDMTWGSGNAFLSYMPYQTFYCPASGFSYDDNTLLWSNYAGGTIHVTGYAQTFVGNQSVNPTNFNTTLTPQRVLVTAPNTWLPAPLASRRVLFADATMSEPGQSNPALVSKYQWTGIIGGFPKPHRTAHMDGALPAGGNVVMLDGHVEWRSFSLMLPQTINSGAPVFWW